MSSSDNLRPSFMDPHGYQPIVIDEDCLTAEDRRAELMESLEAIPVRFLGTPGVSPTSFMTPDELRQFKKPPVQDAPYRINGISIEQEEEKCAIALQAARRAYARKKYGHGQGVWYGDGQPFAPRTA